MTFEEYYQAAPAETKQELNKLFANYGEPTSVLSELSAMQPCVQNNAVDVRINEKYFLWHQNKAFLVHPHTTLVGLQHVRYCYFSYEGNSVSTIGVIGNNGRYLEFSIAGSEETLRIFNKLHTYIRGFENVQPCDPKDRQTELALCAGIYTNAHYILQNDTLSLGRISLFGRRKQDIQVQDINDIIWCLQLMESDSDGVSYIIDLYFLSQREPRRLFFPSAYSGFKFVLELKKRIPHLLYGYNKEYDEIYKRSPAALLAIAKAQR